MPTHELHVIFGTGPLGKNTMRELLRLGKQVRMVNRRGMAEGVPAEVEVVQGDGYDPQSVAAVTQNAAAVYQCAQPEYHQWEEKFPALQRSILKGAAHNGATLIVGDNLYMYGDPDGAVIAEDSPLRPMTKKGRIRHQMAQEIWEVHKRGEVQAAICRASNFFGAEYAVIGDLVFKPALQGKTANLIGRKDVPHTFTYIPDFGKALATLGTRREALGQVWIAPSLPAMTQEQLMEALSVALGKPIKARYANRLIMRIFGLFSPSAKETVEMMYEFEKPYVVSSAKFERAFGIAPTSFDQALKETVQWYSGQGVAVASPLHP